MREMPAPCSRPSPALLGKPIIVHHIGIPWFTLLVRIGSLYWYTLLVHLGKPITFVGSLVLTGVVHHCWYTMKIKLKRKNNSNLTTKMRPVHLDVIPWFTLLVRCSSFWYTLVHFIGTPWETCHGCCLLPGQLFYSLETKRLKITPISSLGHLSLGQRWVNQTE